DMLKFLQPQFASNGLDTYPVEGPVNLNRLSAVYDLVQRPDLKYPIFTPGAPKRLVGATDLFAVIRQKDVLLHHPYQSFVPVMDFLRQAAADPQVLAIKQTLYRAGHDSPLVDALVAAANAGKDVTVIVELRARFDEDVHELCLQLTSLTQTPQLKRLTQSPFGMHEMVLQKLAREAEHARAGRPARVIAKMNALVDPQSIEALYRASRAGVKIELIV